MKRVCLLLVAFLATMLGAGHSLADGALAIGIPDNVAKNGFAYAYINDKSSPDEASKLALSTCQTPGNNKPKVARDLCKVVKTYSNQCVAVAEDPQSGTPGVGWAVADDLHAAEAEALSNCEKTAGPKRRAACAVDHSHCDGSAKQTEPHSN